MPSFFETLFDAEFSRIEIQTVITVVTMLAISFVSKRFIKSPTRPENDSYADAEFEENGVLKKKPETPDQ